jgi:hypothetical protein
MLVCNMPGLLEIGIAGGQVVFNSHLYDRADINKKKKR